MPKRLSIFYSTLLLTIVNLLLRLVGTSFQVYISGVIGVSGVGLLQLVLSVGSLASIAGMAGIRTASMYLTAEELGRNQPEATASVLSACFRYSILCSGIVSSLLFIHAPQIAMYWIRDVRTAPALRLLAGFLPVSCLCGVMTGTFTAHGRIAVLSAVEVLEQLLSILITFLFLKLGAHSGPEYACQAVILGSGGGACLTLLLLSCLHIRNHHIAHSRIHMSERVLQAALPLALADIVKSGINTAENLMVPKRLALNPQTDAPLAAFGIVSGMVFPIIMFPACILFALSELLLPELSQCLSAGKQKRIRYLMRRSQKVAMLYGVAFAGLIFLTGDQLGKVLYNSETAGSQIKLYATIIPILYCDAVTDAMTKGLGRQKISVQFNILTSLMDILFLFILLPQYGMTGYFVSFSITHLINFLLSLRLLSQTVGTDIHPGRPIAVLIAAFLAVLISSFLQNKIAASCIYLIILSCLLCLVGITGKEDINWLKGLLKSRSPLP